MPTLNRQPIPILVYHQIAVAPPKGSPFRGLYVSPAAFARQMAWLKAGLQGPVHERPAALPARRVERQGGWHHL
jgi:hypothetical protein